MKYYKRLEGKRVYLSPICVDDAEIYAKWMNDPKMLKNVGRNSSQMTLLEEQKWIADSHPQVMAIILKEEDRLIGNAGFVQIDQKNRTAELGIFIGEEEYRHQGYGQEVIKLLLEYGFQEHNLHTITLEVFAFNEKAIQTYQKLGFQEVGRKKEIYFAEGTYHDELIMEILEKDWREKNEE